MHVSIITPYPLKAEPLSRSIRRANLDALVFSPDNVPADSLFQTRALIFPQEIEAHFWVQLGAAIQDNAPLKSPLIFEQRIPDIFWLREDLHPLLGRSIPLNGWLQLDVIPQVIREIVAQEKQGSAELNCGTFALDPKARNIRKENQAVFFTRKEYFLLELLFRNWGQIVTRERIIDYVWDSHSFLCSNTVDVYMSRVRRKLRADFSEIQIRTVNSLGYCLEVI